MKVKSHNYQGEIGVAVPVKVNKNIDKGSDTTLINLQELNQKMIALEQTVTELQEKLNSQ